MTLDNDRPDETPRRSDGLSDLIKGAISTGVKSVMVTEEGVRNLLGEFLPKEISTTVKSHLDGLKKDLYGKLVNEFSTFLNDTDLAAELKKALAGVKIRVHTEIEFMDAGKTKPTKKKK